LKKTAVNFSSVTADTPRSFSKAKYCSQEVMNAAGARIQQLPLGVHQPVLDHR
jgi:hypothetical protein